MRQLITIGLVLLLCFTQSFAALATDQAEIQNLYRRALAGDKGAVEQCIAKLEDVLKSQAGNQLARVYLGSAYTLRSRDLGFGPKKLQVLKQGVSVMNEAVAAAPTEPKVRLARALTTSALPAILGYRTESRNDFEELATLAQRAPDKFDDSDLQIVFYNAGVIAKETGQRDRAVGLLKEAQRHRSDEALARRIEAALAGL